MKSKRKFILDTLLPYKQNPETCAMEDESCKYLTDDGKKCAVGKHMKKGEWQNFKGEVELLFDKFYLSNILKKSALDQNLSVKEWSVIQQYHDTISIGEDVCGEVDYLEIVTGLKFPELRN